MVAVVTVFSTHLHSLLPFKCESPGHSIILLTLRGVHFIGGFIEFLFYKCFWRDIGHKSISSLFMRFCLVGM